MLDEPTLHTAVGVRGRGEIPAPAVLLLLARSPHVESGNRITDLDET